MKLIGLILSIPLFFSSALANNEIASKKPSPQKTVKNTTLLTSAFLKSFVGLTAVYSGFKTCQLFIDLATKDIVSLKVKIYGPDSQEAFYGKNDFWPFMCTIAGSAATLYLGLCIYCLHSAKNDLISLRENENE